MTEVLQRSHQHGDVHQGHNQGHNHVAAACFTGSRTTSRDVTSEFAASNLGSIKSQEDALRLLSDRRQSSACHVERKPEVGQNGVGLFPGEYERFKNESARRRTFDDPRWPLSVPVSRDELVRAGWFYTGVADRVRCPWCLGVVYNWEAGDTALGEHKRHFPHCTFARNRIKESFEPPQVSVTSQTPKPKPASPESWRELPSVNAVLELDFTPDQVQNVIRALESKGVPRKYYFKVFSSLEKNVT